MFRYFKHLARTSVVRQLCRGTEVESAFEREHTQKDHRSYSPIPRLQVHAIVRFATVPALKELTFPTDPRRGEQKTK